MFRKTILDKDRISYHLKTLKEITSIVFFRTDTGILLLNRSAICVQNFDDSLNPAIRITYRSSQRSSSTYEPRHPLLKIVFCFVLFYK